jgi:hypothetical protein
MRLRKISGLVLAFAAAPVLFNCGAAGPLGKLPGAPGACKVDVSDPSAIMSANFGLDAELEGKVKAGLAAGANLQKLAVGLEADVVAACSGLAKDLGATDEDLKPKDNKPGAKAEAACKAAIKLVGDIKAKAKGEIKVDVVPPKCSASMDAAASCAAECKGNVDPGSVKVECEGGEISGKCEGKCEGKCQVEAGAQCEGSCGGTCEGTCEANFTGKCDGTCEGTCDGKNAKGKCAGTCDGKCTGKGSGSCSGTCKGSCSASCEMTAKGECKGSCSGSCSVEFKEPKCSGEVKPPEVSAECKANCDAKLNAELECTPARVQVKVAGAADAEAATKLKAAFEKNLPALLKVTVGMKDRIGAVQGSVEASVKGLSAAVKGGGDAALKVGGCVAGALKAQAEASVSIKASVSVSAEASASAGAG